MILFVTGQGEGLAMREGLRCVGRDLREVGCEPSGSLEEEWSRQRGADPKLPEAGSQ